MAVVPAPAAAAAVSFAFNKRSETVEATSFHVVSVKRISSVQVQSSYHGGMNGRGPEKFGNFVFCLNSSWPSYFELLSIVQNASQSVAVFVRLTLRFLLIYLFFRQQERRT